MFLGKVFKFYSPTNNQISYMMGQYYFVFPNVKSFYFRTKNDGGTNRLVIYRSDLNIHDFYFYDME